MVLALLAKNFGRFIADTFSLISDNFQGGHAYKRTGGARRKF